MREGVRLKGVDELRANLHKIGAAPILQREVAVQLYREGQQLMSKSRRYVPVDPGVRSEGLPGTGCCYSGVALPRYQFKRPESLRFRALLADTARSDLCRGVNFGVNPA
jgi:hypothetical protein